MKYKDYNWIVLALFSLVFYSCVEEVVSEVPQSGSDVSMNLSLNAGVVGDPLASTHEVQIRSLRLYIFNNRGFDRMHYFGPGELLNNGYLTPEFGVTPNDGIYIYAVANEPLDSQGNTLPAFKNVRSTNDIEQLKFVLEDAGLRGNIKQMTYADLYLPMFGESNTFSLVSDQHASTPAQIDLTRCLARVDVSMKNEDDGDIKILEIGYKNSTESGYIMPVTLTNPTTDDLNGSYTSVFTDSVVNKNAMQQYASFYIPERLYASTESNPLLITFKVEYPDGTVSSKELELGNDAVGNAKLSKIERNKVYQFNATLIRRSIETQLTVCSWVYLPHQDDEIVKDNLSMVNCYILNPGDKEVAISLRNVYYAWAMSPELGKRPIPSGKQTVELLWQAGARPRTYTQGSELLPSIKPKLIVDAKNPQNSYITVSSGYDGNGVIVFKVDGVVYWSWHIWSTNYKPNITDSSYVDNGYTWMDRNLGAIANTYQVFFNSSFGEDISGRAKGMLYQWGRKDPFPASQDWSNKNKDVYGYASSGSTAGVGLVSYANVDESTIISDSIIIKSVRNPFTYYTTSGRGSGGEWCPTNPYKSTLWVNNKKSIFDPCPANWRVPEPPVNGTSSPWANLGAAVLNATNKGYYYNTTYYYPYTYYRDLNGTLSGNNMVTFWSTGVATDGYYGMSYVGSIFSPWVVYKGATARAVRCVKENN